MTVSHFDIVFEARLSNLFTYIYIFESRYHN
jgi:hypothetical protein